MPGVATRVATLADFSPICALDSLTPSDARRREFLATACRRGWVTLAERDQRVIAFSVVHHHFFNRPFLALLIVDPALRRQGVARQLVVQAIEVHSELWTSTNASNAAAQAFFAALGFVRAGVIEGLDAGDPELIFRGAHPLYPGPSPSGGEG